MASLWENITYQISWNMTQKCKVLPSKKWIYHSKSSYNNPGKFLSSIHIKILILDKNFRTHKKTPIWTLFYSTSNSNAEGSSDIVQYTFMIKNQSKAGIKKCFNLIKDEDNIKLH